MSTSCDNHSKDMRIWALGNTRISCVDSNCDALNTRKSNWDRETSRPRVSSSATATLLFFALRSVGMQQKAKLERREKWSERKLLQYFENLNNGMLFVFVSTVE